MVRMVTVDARGDHLVLASLSTSDGRYPLFHRGDWAERAEEPLDDAALGGLVREAFRNCLVGVPSPDRRNNPEGRARVSPLQKLGKARSATAYARTTRRVALLWDDGKRTILLRPTQSDTRGGFGGIPGTEIVVKDKVSDAGLGSAVRQAIAAARSLVG
jgi:hypothetical protein